jgi:DNA ligase-1
VDYHSADFRGLSVAADWIIDLESSSSRLHKERVIEKALMAATLGSHAAVCFLFNCYQAYNPFYVFNVRQVPETQGLTHQPNDWIAFWALLESLRTRAVTGHAARDAIEQISREFDSEEWNRVCRPVILKDLRCGITDKTLNKVLGKTQWQIPVFSVQLAQDSNDHAAKLKGVKRLEQKLDGVRVIAVVNLTSVNLYSRNGKPFNNFPHIEQQLMAVSRELSQRLFGRVTDFVLDGEIVGESFQALMTQAQRKTNVDASDSQYFVFDAMPKVLFLEGRCDTPQHARTHMLASAMAELAADDAPDVQMISGIDVDLDTAEGHDVMRRYAADIVAAGFEGILIKDVDAPYQCKRTSSWLKFKPVVSVDLTIVGVEEGTGKNVGRMGALVCEGTDAGRPIRVNVGSGFSDEQRVDYWTNQGVLLGQTVEILCDIVTQNQDGGYSLRFPRFMRFRDDK